MLAKGCQEHKGFGRLLISRIRTLSRSPPTQGADANAAGFRLAAYSDLPRFNNLPILKVVRQFDADSSTDL
jgi:hypothetical protein